MSSPAKNLNQQGEAVAARRAKAVLTANGRTNVEWLRDMQAAGISSPLRREDAMVVLRWAEASEEPLDRGGNVDLPGYTGCVFSALATLTLTRRQRRRGLAKWMHGNCSPESRRGRIRVNVGDQWSREARRALVRDIRQTRARALQGPRVRSCSRPAGRPARRSTRSSAASGDSGDDDHHHPEPSAVSRPASERVFLCPGVAP